MLSICISNRKSETNLRRRVPLCILDFSLAGALSHMNHNSTLFEAELIHQRFHQVNPTTMNRRGVLGSSRIRYPVNVKSSSLVLYRDGDLTRFTAATNIDVLPGFS